MAKKLLYFEDVEVGMEIPSLAKIATTQMLVKWAGAWGSDDFNPLHYEDTFAANQVVGRPIVQGGLKRAWLGQLVTSWIGDEGFIKRLSCQYRGMDYPRKMKDITQPEEGETWLCKGTVTGKRVKDDQHIVELEIWVENGKGERTTPGAATVILPSKNVEFWGKA